MSPPGVLVQDHQCLLSYVSVQLGDDLFVMPTIPDRFGDGGTDFMGGERRQRHNRATAAPLPLTMPDRNPITALPTGLELQDTMLM